MLMSDLTHSSLACKAHLNMSIENALYKLITITITISINLLAFYHEYHPRYSFYSLSFLFFSSGRLLLRVFEVSVKRINKGDR